MKIKNIYELLNFHLWIKSISFKVWVRYFLLNFKGTLWNFTQNILPIHWKIWFSYNIEILRAFRFMSLYAFLKCPPAHWHICSISQELCMWVTLCCVFLWLTHWGRVMHICVSKLTIIASDNGFSPGRRQAIIRTYAGILLIGPQGTNFNDI